MRGNQGWGFLAFLHKRCTGFRISLEEVVRGLAEGVFSNGEFLHSAFVSAHVVVKFVAAHLLGSGLAEISRRNDVTG